MLIKIVVLQVICQVGVPILCEALTDNNLEPSTRTKTLAHRTEWKHMAKIQNNKDKPLINDLKNNIENSKPYESIKKSESPYVTSTKRVDNTLMNTEENTFTTETIKRRDILSLKSKRKKKVSTKLSSNPEDIFYEYFDYYDEELMRILDDAYFDVIANKITTSTPTKTITTPVTSYIQSKSLSSVTKMTVVKIPESSKIYNHITKSMPSLNTMSFSLHPSHIATPTVYLPLSSHYSFTTQSVNPTSISTSSTKNGPTRLYLNRNFRYSTIKPIMEPKNKITLNRNSTKSLNTSIIRESKSFFRTGGPTNKTTIPSRSFRYILNNSSRPKLNNKIQSSIDIESIRSQYKKFTGIRKHNMDNDSGNNSKLVVTPTDIASDTESVYILETHVESETSLKGLLMHPQPSSKTITNTKISKTNTNSTFLVKGQLGIQPEGSAPMGVLPFGLTPKGVRPFGIAPEGFNPFGLLHKQNQTNMTSPGTSNQNSSNPEILVSTTSITNQSGVIEGIDDFQNNVNNSGTGNYQQISTPPSLNGTATNESPNIAERYHMQIKKPDGTTVGDFLIVDKETGQQNGVRYGVAVDVDPTLVHEILLDFLSLDPDPPKK